MRLKQNTAQGDTRVYILDQAILLFAAHGYSGVSMRDLSKAVGISTAALYHHFPDKQSLYLDAMEYVFADKAEEMTIALDGDGAPLERLEQFIIRFVELMGSDPSFRALLQRELLDGNETRLKLLAERVFVGPFQAITALAKDLDPDCDPHMLAISMTGLVLFHYEIEPLSSFLPGGRRGKRHKRKITNHLTDLLTKAFEPR